MSKQNELATIFFRIDSWQTRIRYCCSICLEFNIHKKPIMTNAMSRP